MPGDLRGIEAARRATVRICDRAGNLRGQGLLLHLPHEGVVVLTCHHVIAPLSPGDVCIQVPGHDSRLGEMLPVTYDRQRSRPSQDAVVLRVDTTQFGRWPTPYLHVLDPSDYDGSLPDRATGLTYLQPNNFDARVAASTHLSIGIAVAGGWPDPPTAYELDAFRLADTTDARPGISGAVVVCRGGVLGLAHFARAAAPAHEREVYLVPLSVWAEGWSALTTVIHPLDVPSVVLQQYILRPDMPDGGVVETTSVKQQVLEGQRPTPKPSPRQQLPLARDVIPGPPPPVRFPGFRDRKEEMATAVATIASASSVEFRGPPGMGRTSLLYHLAYHAYTPDFADGIVWLSARHQPVDDVLQMMYDTYFNRQVGDNTTYKPNDVEIRYALKGKHALILVDDVELDRSDVERLMSAAPGFTFLLTSTKRRLWAGGRSVMLKGLPQEDALALVERELDRPLTPEERRAVDVIWTELEGNPLRLVQEVLRAEEDGLSLTEVASEVQAASSKEALTFQTVASLPDAHQRALLVLAALTGADLGTQHIASLAELEDPVSVLSSLERRLLVQSHSPRYSLTGPLAYELGWQGDLVTWRSRVLNYLANWAEEHRWEPDRQLEEATAILRISEWAIGVGSWSETLRLARSVESAFAAAGRGGSWAQLLGWSLQAARALGDQAAEAWALHQLGTRALCLGDPSAARDQLTQALQLRESLGDRYGANVTRHNLNLLPPPFIVAPAERTTVVRRVTRSWKLLLIALGVAIVLLVIWVTARSMEGGRTVDPAVVLPTSAGPAPTAMLSPAIASPTSAGASPTAGPPSAVVVTPTAESRVEPATATSEPVRDSTEPALSGLPPDMTVEATGSLGATASWNPPTASDTVDGAITPNCSPASGSTFAIGATTVTCSATDEAGNTGSATFKVTVEDTTGPEVTVPADIIVNATGPLGAVVAYNASATDTVDGAITPSCSPASGATFVQGTTTVTCSAKDRADNTGSASFKVTVKEKRVSTSGRFGLVLQLQL